MSKRKHHRPEFKAKVALAKLKGVSRRLTGFGAETAYSPLTRGRRIASVHHRKSSLKYVAVCRSTMFMSRKLLDRRARSTWRVKESACRRFFPDKALSPPQKNATRRDPRRNAFQIGGVMSDDSFIPEVDEELRQDRARDLWRRYGIRAIAVRHS